jgi:PEP-CTERM motif
MKLAAGFLRAAFRMHFEHGAAVYCTLPREDQDRYSVFVWPWSTFSGILAPKGLILMPSEICRSMSSLLTVIATLTLAIARCNASYIAADLYNPNVPNATPGATYNLLAYSIQIIPFPGGPNQLVSGGTFTIFPIVVSSFGLFTPLLRSYSPTYTTGGLTTGPGASVVSASDGNGSGGPYGIAAFIPGTPNIVALTAKTNGALGAAAAQAVDPETLSPGTYSDYSPTIDLTDLELDSTGDSAAVNFYATDSRFSTPLWYLSMWASGQLNGKSDLNISFTSNPILGLNNSLVAANVLSDLTVAGGQAFSTSPIALFTTTYTVDQQITYSQDVVGYADAVPEPASWALVCGGLAAMAFRPRARRA